VENTLLREGAIGAFEIHWPSIDQSAAKGGDCHVRSRGGIGHYTRGCCTAVRRRFLPASLQTRAESEFRIARPGMLEALN
jgi:hypothetical protein